MRVGRTVGDQSWLAVAAMTETNRPNELPYVMTVMKNRTTSGAHPSDLFDVIMEKFQFSAFNEMDRSLPEAELYALTRGMLRLGDTGSRVTVLESVARACAHAVLEMPVSLMPDVLLYWSPISMKPKGALPRWNWRIVSCFTVHGIDQSRLVFAAPHELWEGNQKQYDLSSKL